MSSRLFQEIREKRGLVYTIRASAESDSDTGIFNIYAGTGEKEVKELMPVLCDELCDFKLRKSLINRTKSDIINKI